MRNDRLIESKYNVKFEEILQMNEEDFHDWAVGLRQTVVDLWDNHGLPPVVGYTDEQIIDQFSQLESYPVHKDFLKKDELTGTMDVIRNTSNLGNAVNSYFPAMMKTPIGYNGDGTGKSIYDFFAKDELLERFKTYSRRHFKRDSFYHYSNPIKPRDQRYPQVPMVDTGVDFVRDFEKHASSYVASRGWYYWICPVKEDAEYTGYDEKLKGQKYLTLNRAEIEQLVSEKIIKIGEGPASNIDFERSESYTIRVFELGQKIFPLGFKAFKISFSQYAVNFPPLTAKYLYERFTMNLKRDNPNEPLNVYDPSMGWGGRLLGALSVRDDLRVNYIGTDPNSDNMSRYCEVYETYTRNIRKGGLFELPHNGIVSFGLGSEVIADDPLFQTFKGKLDFAFTSPPYFEKEQYSQEPTQSFKKFPQYDLWVNGFLRPTIKTICEYLRHDRYAVWNIADVKFGNEMLPLEEDSMKAFQDYGMRFMYKLKMALSPMPGGNRTKEDGTGTAKNTCKVNGLLLKYEPLFVFYKP